MSISDENSFFTPQQLAEITGGTWENLSNNLLIGDVNYIPQYTNKGDLFVIRHEDWPNKKYLENIHRIPEVIAKGIAAIMVNQETLLDVRLPVLRVVDTYRALRKIAINTSKISTAKRVLVTGSYGKTAFKTHLWHLLNDHLNTYISFNSANFSASTYCNFASLKKDTQVVVIEKPITNESNILRNARIIEPDIIVLTSIGHEHIDKFKTIDNIIWLKTTFASGLPSDGKFIVPYDSEYYPLIINYLKRYPDINILTFGSHPDCNARILKQNFRQFGWDVLATIEGQEAAYRVPFPEGHAPNASLAELLCVYHLGVDIQVAAANYYQCTNFKSSGSLYEVNYQQKHFYLYDQSQRGGIEGYSSFFKTLRNLKPEGQGKKIVVTSNFVDHVDGEVALLDLDHFRQLMSAAGIDSLFTVEYFTEHPEVVHDKSIWKGHSFEVDSIKDEVINSLQNNDILCVKGIYESKLPDLISHIKHLPGIKISKVISTPWNNDIPF